MKNHLPASFKKMLFLCIIFLVCLCLFPVFCYAYESGLELATAVHDRPDGDNAFTIGVMALLEKGHKPRVRQIISFRQDKPNGYTLSLIRFKKPADIKDTGLLTIDYEQDKDSDQWIYLPTVKKSRRIASIFYEDLRKRRVKDDNHSILRKEKYNGMETIVLEYS